MLDPQNDYKAVSNKCTVEYKTIAVQLLLELSEENFTIPILMIIDVIGIFDYLFGWKEAKVHF